MLQRRTVTRNIPALTLRAEVVPSSWNEEQRTVDVVWTTGARVLRGFWEQFFEELSLDPRHVRMKRLQGGKAPVLNAHRSYDANDTIGVVQTAELQAKRGVATIRFARAEHDPAADQIFRKIGDRIIGNVSVGYRVHRLEKIEQELGKIPVYRATDWEPYEVSVVPIGADEGAVVRSDDTKQTNRCEFVIEERKMALKKRQKGTTAAETPTAIRAEAAEEDEVPAAEAEEETAVEPEPETPVRTPPPGVASTRTAAAEPNGHERIMAMYRIARSLRLPDALVEQHVRDGSSLATFRAVAQDQFAAADPIDVRSSTPSINAGEDTRDKWRRGAAAWLFLRSRLSDTLHAAAKKRDEKMIDLDPGEFRGLSLVDLARQSLERGGQRTMGLSRSSIVAAAFRTGNMGTGDFPIVLENVLHKTLLAAYAVTADTWTRFCAQGSVSDFREHPRYRMGSFGTLFEVIEDEEYKTLTLGDAEKESIRATTKGAIIGLTRRMIIDDDMGVFTRIAMMAGRAAKLTIEKDVFATLQSGSGLGPLLADGKTLFHADHKNISTSAALSVDALDADRVTMAIQTDPSNNELLDLTPAILLVPIGLGGNARVIVGAEYDPDTANKLQRPNKVRNLFRDIVDSGRLTSATRRWVFADPAVAPVLEVAFLDGQSEPYLENKDGWRTDGTEWKVRLDFAVGGVDYRGAVTNAGT